MDEENTTAEVNPMDDLLAKVKTNIGLTTDDTDVNKNIIQKIMGVMGYLIKGGANLPTDEAEYSKITSYQIMCISIGVNDLLNGDAGETKFSPAFKMFAMQICR